jgi:hypothetical protein
MNGYYQSLSISNLIILLSLIRKYTKEAFGYDLKSQTNFSCSIIKFIEYYGAPLNAYLVVFISADRLFTIAYPAHWITIKIFKKYRFLCIVSMAIINVLLFSPFAIYSTLKITNMTLISSETNSSMTQFKKKCEINTIDIKQALNLFDLIFSNLIPFFFMFTCTFLIINAIRVSRAKMKKNLKKSTKIASVLLGRDIKFGIISVLINIIFLSLNLPGAIENLISVSNESITILLNNIYFCNSMLLFFINLTSNSIFRNYFLSFFKN